MTLDSVSYVDFKLTKVEVPVDSLSEFDRSNTRVIYDVAIPELATQDARKLAAQYVNYTDVRTRVVQGTAVSYFSTKLKDTNLYFSASLTARDPSGNSVINLESPEYQVQVRGDRLFLNSYTIDGPNLEDVYVGSNDIIVSETPKVFLIDTNQKFVEDVSAAIFAENTTPEKTILALTNYSKNGNILPLAYPLTFMVRRDGQDVFEDSGITRTDLATYKSFPAFTESGKYDFIVKDASGFLATKTLYYVPEVVANIDVTLGTTVAETGGTITTHLLTLKDRFGNITSGDIYSVRGEITG